MTMQRIDFEKSPPEVGAVIYAGNGSPYIFKGIFEDAIMVCEDYRSSPWFEQGDSPYGGVEISGWINGSQTYFFAVDPERSKRRELQRLDKEISEQATVLESLNKQIEKKRAELESINNRLKGGVND